MHAELAARFVASIRARVSQGDRPTLPPLSVENLEDLVLTLADQLSSRRADTAEAAEVVGWRYRYRSLSLPGWSKWVVVDFDPSVAFDDAKYEIDLQPLYGPDTIATLSSQVEGLRVERDEALDVMEKTRAVYENLEASEIVNGYKNRAEKAEAALASQAIPEGFVLAPTEAQVAAIDRLDAALCNFINAVGDQFNPLEEWSAETKRNLAELGATYDQCHKVGAMNFSRSAARHVAALAAIPAAPEVNK